MPTTLADKLQLKSGQALVALNTPPGYLERLTELLGGVSISIQSNEPSSAVLVFVNDLTEAAQWVPTGIRAVTSDGLLWVAYPKGTSGVKTDINRDRLWETTTTTGWRPVRQIALDDTWSAVRFRPADRVSSRSG